MSNTADDIRADLNGQPFRDAVLELVSAMDLQAQVELYDLIRAACERLAKRAAMGAAANGDFYRGHYG